MRVNPFAASDIEEVIALARRNLAESRFGRLPFDEAMVRGKLEKMATAPQSANFAVVARREDGRMSGYMAGTVAEYFYCHERVASSVFLFVDPVQRGGLAAVKMVLAFRAWARSRGAVEMYIGVAGGVNMERTGRFLQRMGLKLTGGNYSVWLEPV